MIANATLSFELPAGLLNSNLAYILHPVFADKDLISIRAVFPILDSIPLDFGGRDVRLELVMVSCWYAFRISLTMMTRDTIVADVCNVVFQDIVCRVKWVLLKYEKRYRNIYFELHESLYPILITSDSPGSFPLFVVFR